MATCSRACQPCGLSSRGAISDQELGKLRKRRCNTRARLGRVLRFLMKQSFLPVLFCTAVLVNIVFQAVLFSRIDYPGHQFRTYFAMGSFIALAFLVACQSLYLLKLQNQIGSLERRAEKMFAGVQSRSDFWIPDIKGPEVIRYSIIRLDQLSRRFIGLGL